MKKVVLALSVLFAGNVLMAKSGAELAKGCIGCHGAKFEKKAMGKSKVVNSMTEKEIEEELIAFKEGKKKSPVMEMQAKKLSAEDIKVLAKYIPTLKK
ncbi:c-type cytochrome [Helicobacter cetorum]|uniref:Cytochrome c-553 n=1 Tax=Helicobacter cetorum (strain ATCC BAA-540 / CCUG 52418 / MIT 99-5656) TaxID=1163745 RepID=I0EUB0_HELCM|nr:cytochrome c [Helicobacter cetorum]AFI06529.1 cytochrome c-553 [Helicobacter cetorum MIT 99-5656]